MIVPANKPHLSVIVPTFNRWPALARLLDGLAKQSADSPFETIVISDGSTDGTNERLAHATYPFIMRPVILETNVGPGAARNRGVAAAQGQFVLFLDDDVVPSAALIAEHLSAHAAQREDVVVLGALLAPPQADLAPWARWELAMFAKLYRSLRTTAPSGRHFWTGNVSVSRAQVLAAGGFDVALRRFEDIDLGYRLAKRGLRFTFNDRAMGYHWPTRSYESWLAHAYAFGRHDVAAARRQSDGWPLEMIWRELAIARHPLIRMLVRVAVCRPRTQRVAIASLRAIAAVFDPCGFERAVEMAYSGIFQLQYYQGVADEVGGRNLLRAGVAAARSAATAGVTPAVHVDTRVGSKGRM